MSVHWATPHEIAQEKKGLDQNLLATIKVGGDENASFLTILYFMAGVGL